MCNITLALAPNSLSQRDSMFLTSLYAAESIKHSDGFGICTPFSEISNWGNIYKTPVKAAINFSYMSSPFFEKLIGKRAVLAHMRKTSSGRVLVDKKASDEEKRKAWEKRCRYTHPFEFENLVLVHNGTMTPKDDKVEMDSLHLAEKISEFRRDMSMQEAIKSGLGEFKDGSYTLVIFDKEEKSFYIARGVRPLHFFKTPFGWLFNTDKYKVDNLAEDFKIWYPDFKVEGGDLIKKGIHVIRNPLTLGIELLEEGLYLEEKKTNVVYYGGQKYLSKPSSGARKKADIRKVSGSGKKLFDLLTDTIPSTITKTLLSVAKELTTEEILSLLKFSPDALADFLERCDGEAVSKVYKEMTTP